MIAYLDRARTVFNVNALAQAAAPAALADTEHVARVRAHAAAARARFTEELTALGLQPVPSATNFMAVKVNGDDAAMAAALLERGIAVNPIGGWGLPGHIRISFGTDEENERFFAALREVWCKAHRRRSNRSESHRPMKRVHSAAPSAALCLG